jgi:hypothetical protein
MGAPQLQKHLEISENGAENTSQQEVQGVVTPCYFEWSGIYPTHSFAQAAL